MEISRARGAVAAAFLAQGLVLLSLTTRLPEITDHWHLSEVELSLILLMMLLLAGGGSVVAEALAKRRDSATLLRVGLLLVAVAVPVLCVAPAVGLFVGGIALYGLGLGIVDATSNMQAVALEHRYARPILPSFHGAWTLGALLGSVLTGLVGSGSLRVGFAIPMLLVLLLIPIARAFAPTIPATDRAGAREAPAW